MSSKRMYELGKEQLEKEFQYVEVERYFKDLFGYNPDGDCVEIEVKCSDYDFYKEFTKPCKKAKHLAYKYHNRKGKGFSPTRYYFLVPSILQNKALTRIKKEYPKYGLIVYSSKEDKIFLLRKAKRLHDRPFKGERLATPFTDYVKHFRDNNFFGTK